MRILGLSFGFHDSAAALVVDGQVVAAAQEERFSRNKNDPGFPLAAAQFCLEQAQILAQDIDLVAYHEDALTKFDRIVKSWVGNYVDHGEEFEGLVASWIRGKKIRPASNDRRRT